MPFVAFYHTHKLVVVLFVVIYLVKAVLLLMGNNDTLSKFNKKIRIPEMVISALFFITGIIMLNNIADFTMLFAIKLTLVVAAIPVAVIAYKKYNKILAILSILMLLSAYGLAEMYKGMFANKKEIANVVTNPDDAQYDLIEHGQALFNAQCIVCHGVDGKANLSGAKDLTLSTKPEQEMVEIIKTGKNTMPRMADIYNEAELNALAKYVKSLR
jgi:mono/diheme cytochrome c family protein